MLGSICWRGNQENMAMSPTWAIGRLNPTPLSYVLPTGPTMGAIFKDEDLREQHVETIWTYT